MYCVTLILCTVVVMRNLERSKGQAAADRVRAADVLERQAAISKETSATPRGTPTIEVDGWQIPTRYPDSKWMTLGLLQMEKRFSRRKRGEEAIHR